MQPVAGPVYVMRVLVALILSTLLSAAPPREVAILDAGAPPERVVAVVAAVRALMPTAAVVADSDARELFTRFGRACTDDDCWIKVALAGDVGAVVVVGADSLAWVDGVAFKRRVAPLSDDIAVEPVLEQLAFPERFAPLRIVTRPENAAVVVDGRPFVDGLVRAGRHEVVVSAAGHQDRRQVVDVAATPSITIELEPLPATTPPPGPAEPEAEVTVAPWALLGGGVVVATVGIVGVVVGEAFAQDAITAIRVDREDTGALAAAENIQYVGIAAAVVGTIVGVVGGVLVATSGDRQ